MKNIMLMQINIYFTAERDRRSSEGRVDLGYSMTIKEDSEPIIIKKRINERKKS